MGKGLTDRDRAIIQQVILDRWNPLRLNKKIATHFCLTINQVRHLRSKPVFQAEYKRQLAIYQQSFDEIQLGRPQGTGCGHSGTLRDDPRHPRGPEAEDFGQF
jgi:hypothetical protein